MTIWQYDGVKSISVSVAQNQYVVRIVAKWIFKKIPLNLQTISTKETKNRGLQNTIEYL